MRSLVGAILRRPTNTAPVPYTGRGNVSIPWRTPTGAEAQMRAMGSVGTLFAIVHRLSNATAQVGWGLYRQAATGQKPEEREQVTRHLALDIWNKPNGFYSRQEFIETFEQHLELTGEAWWVIARNPRAKTPLELWPVRPDRMAPDPDPDEFLTGYTYTTPDGIQIDLELDEVIQLKMPNPLDPYRGMGPVQTILTDLDATRYSAEWNKNFFLNSAEPGGLIQVDHRLGDDEFNELRDRWNEQHKGVANAHRVAIIEQGQWIDRKFTMRDMQFAELRSVASEVIREAFGFPKPMLGTVEDVNRANAEAAEVVFARWLIVERLERIKQVLNTRFLPLFGTTGSGLEFDYTSPVPEDREADNAELTAKANAAATLVTVGFDSRDVLETVGLPEMRFAAPAPPPIPAAAPVPEPPAMSPAARLDIHHHAPAAALPPPERARALSMFDLARARQINAATPPPPEDLPDITPMLEALNTSLDQLMAEWRALTQAQKEALAAQVQKVAQDGQISDLADLTVDTTASSAALSAAMTAIAAVAAQQVVAEAAAQGVELSAVTVPAAVFEQVAGVVAALLADELKVAAARAAMAANSPDATPAAVADAVAKHLDDVSDASPRKQLGGALHGSMNAARLATLKAGPVGAIYASERNDRNTCQPCRDIDGTWLGNTDDLAQVEKSYPAGAYGGYIHCEGGVQCRGTVVGVWRPKQVKQ